MGGPWEVLSKRDDMHSFSDIRNGLAVGKGEWSSRFVGVLSYRCIACKGREMEHNS